MNNTTSNTLNLGKVIDKYNNNHDQYKKKRSSNSSDLTSSIKKSNSLYKVFSHVNHANNNTVSKNSVMANTNTFNHYDQNYDKMTTPISTQKTINKNNNNKLLNNNSHINTQKSLKNHSNKGYYMQCMSSDDHHILKHMNESTINILNNTQYIEDNFPKVLIDIEKSVITLKRFYKYLINKKKHHRKQKSAHGGSSNSGILNYIDINNIDIDWVMDQYQKFYQRKTKNISELYEFFLMELVPKISRGKINVDEPCIDYRTNKMKKQESSNTRSIVDQNESQSYPQPNSNEDFKPLISDFSSKSIRGNYVFSIPPTPSNTQREELNPEVIYKPFDEKKSQSPQKNHMTSNAYGGSYRLSNGLSKGSENSTPINETIRSNGNYIKTYKLGDFQRIDQKNDKLTLDYNDIVNFSPNVKYHPNTCMNSTTKLPFSKSKNSICLDNIIINQGSKYNSKINQSDQKFSMEEFYLSPKQANKPSKICSKSMTKPQHNPNPNSNTTISNQNRSTKSTTTIEKALSLSKTNISTQHKSLNGSNKNSSTSNLKEIKTLLTNEHKSIKDHLLLDKSDKNHLISPTSISSISLINPLESCNNLLQLKKSPKSQTKIVIPSEMSNNSGEYLVFDKKSRSNIRQSLFMEPSIQQSFDDNIEKINNSSEKEKKHNNNNAKKSNEESNHHPHQNQQQHQQQHHEYHEYYSRTNFFENDSKIHNKILKKNILFHKVKHELNQKVRPFTNTNNSLSGLLMNGITNQKSLNMNTKGNNELHENLNIDQAVIERLSEEDKDTSNASVINQDKVVIMNMEIGGKSPGDSSANVGSNNGGIGNNNERIVNKQFTQKASENCFEKKTDVISISNTDKIPSIHDPNNLPFNSSTKATGSLKNKAETNQHFILPLKKLRIFENNHLKEPQEQESEERKFSRNPMCKFNQNPLTISDIENILDASKESLILPENSFKLKTSDFISSNNTENMNKIGDGNDDIHQKNGNSSDENSFLEGLKKVNAEKENPAFSDTIIFEMNQVKCEEKSVKKADTPKNALKELLSPMSIHFDAQNKKLQLFVPKKVEQNIIKKPILVLGKLQEDGLSPNLSLLNDKNCNEEKLKNNPSCNKKSPSDNDIDVLQGKKNELSVIKSDICSQFKSKLDPGINLSNITKDNNSIITQTKANQSRDSLMHQKKFKQEYLAPTID